MPCDIRNTSEHQLCLPDNCSLIMLHYNVGMLEMYAMSSFASLHNVKFLRSFQGILRSAAAVPDLATLSAS